MALNFNETIQRIKEAGLTPSEEAQLIGMAEAKFGEQFLQDTTTTPADVTGVTITEPLQKTPQKILEEQIAAERLRIEQEESPGFTAAFPRLAEAQTAQRPFGQQALSTGADLLSLVGRAVASSPELFSDQERAFIEDLRKTSGTGMIEDIVRSPELGAAAIAAPIVGPMAAGGMRGALGAGAIEGTIGGAVTQAERVGRGEDIQPEEFLADVGISVLVPGVLKPVGDIAAKPAKEMFKKAAEQIGQFTGFDEELLTKFKGGFGKQAKELKKIKLDERAALTLAEDVTDLINNMPRFNTSENKALDLALSRMGKMDVNPLLKEIEGLKIKPRAERKIQKGSSEDIVNTELDKIIDDIGSGKRTISARDFYLDRVDLDKSINWDALNKEFPKASDDLEKKLIELRTSMQNRLKTVAKQTDNEAFINIMDDLSQKLDVRDKLIKNIGRNPESFVNNLFGKNKTITQENLKKLDELFGTDFSEKAGLINLSKPLLKSGQLPLTGRGDLLKSLASSPQAFSLGLGATEAAAKGLTAPKTLSALGLGARQTTEAPQFLTDLLRGEE